MQPADGGAQLRQRLTAVSERNKVAAVRRACDDAGRHALIVRDILQHVHKLVAADAVFRQLLHGVEARVDALRAEQRLFQPAAQHAAAHGRFGMVQHPQEAAALFPRAHGLRQLQIAPGTEIQLHEAAADIEFQLPHMGKARFLQLAERPQQRARAAPDLRPLREAKLIERLAELLFHELRRLLRSKQLVRAKIGAAAQPLLQCAGQLLAFGRVAAAQHLGRGKAPQLGDDALHSLRTLGLRGIERAGRNIAEAQAVAPALAEDAGKIIVAALVEHGAFDDRSRRDNAGDIPLDKALGQRRVLHLFADGDLVAARNEPCDIALCRVIRHAAHGDLLGLFLAAIPRRERQVKLMGSKLGIVGKHFIKIAQAEKQDAVRVPFLDLQILPHHRRQFSHTSSPSVCAVRRARPSGSTSCCP